MSSEGKNLLHEVSTVLFDPLISHVVEGSLLYVLHLIMRFHQQ